MTQLDPDRFFNRTSPGAHEWWYFDAISDDGRDTLVIVWYAGLPFDPSYGVATLRHLRKPSRYPQPRALDHSAIGFSWHRDGKPIAYALNGFQADQFHSQADPFAVEVATSRVERIGSDYRLTVATPTVDGRPIRAEFQFRPVDGTIPFERNLGTTEAPHDWILAAADCRVEGSATIGQDEFSIVGRGYHDHNAGAEDLAIAMMRWEWGRVHHGPFTEIYYECSTRRQTRQELWITCRDGRPVTIREGAEFDIASRPIDGKSAWPNMFGLRHDLTRDYSERSRSFSRTTEACLDDGPFYRRWLAKFEVDAGQEESPIEAKGIAELLETGNLHKPWFNWMIPYRLKWPRP